jgi:hypothetical protein
MRASSWQPNRLSFPEGRIEAAVPSPGKSRMPWPVAGPISIFMPGRFVHGFSTDPPSHGMWLPARCLDPFRRLIPQPS